MILNIWAIIIIVMQVISVLLTPFVIGKDKGKYTWVGWVSNIITLIILLLALGLKIGFSF